MSQPLKELRVGQHFHCRPGDKDTWMKIEVSYHKGKIEPRGAEFYWARDAVLLTGPQAGQLGFFGDDFAVMPL